MVYEATVVNLGGRSVPFKLIPPEARDYQPYRGPIVASNATAPVPPPGTGGVRYRAEAIIGLSIPPKLPIPIDIPPTQERIYQWWQVPQLRAAAILLLVILGAAVFVIARAFSRLRARRNSG